MRLNKSFAIPFFTTLGTTAYADSGIGNNWGPGHMWESGYGMFGGLMMVLFWGIVIALIVMAVRRYGMAQESPIKTPRRY